MTPRTGIAEFGLLPPGLPRAYASRDGGFHGFTPHHGLPVPSAGGGASAGRYEHVSRECPGSPRRNGFGLALTDSTTTGLRPRATEAPSHAPRGPGGRAPAGDAPGSGRPGGRRARSSCAGSPPVIGCGRHCPQYLAPRPAQAPGTSGGLASHPRRGGERAGRLPRRPGRPSARRLRPHHPGDPALVRCREPARTRPGPGPSHDLFAAVLDVLAEGGTRLVPADVISRRRRPGRLAGRRTGSTGSAVRPRWLRGTARGRRGRGRAR